MLSFNYVDPSITFPNLTSLCLYDCRLEGWKNFFKSLTSLKHLALNDTELVGIAPNDILYHIPDNVSRRLETLRICYKSHPDVSRVEAHFPSLPSLRKLTLYYLSPTSLASLFTYIPNLESLCFVPLRNLSCGSLSHAHLEVFTRFSLPSLKMLTLHGGDFTSDSIMAFAVKCPPSLRALKLSRCRGITPSSLRSLLRLPLSQLTVIGLGIFDSQELKDIVETEKNEGFEKSHFEFL